MMIEMNDEPHRYAKGRKTFRNKNIWMSFIHEAGCLGDVCS
jgi:hypothetical protein